MLKNFENITNELSAEELALAKHLIPHFQKRTKENPVLASEVVEGVNKVYKLSFKFNDARLRKIINYYRVNSILPILSSKKGYYCSNDVNDIMECCSSLTQRLTSISDCVIGLQRYIKNNL